MATPVRHTLRQCPWAGIRWGHLVCDKTIWLIESSGVTFVLYHTSPVLTFNILPFFYENPVFLFTCKDQASLPENTIVPPYLKPCLLTEQSEWINTVFILSTVYSITQSIHRNISTILLLYFWSIIWCQNPTFSLSTSKASHMWCETHCVGCPQSIFKITLGISDYIFRHTKSKLS